MAQSRAILLIGQLKHCEKEWQALSSLATLKVSLTASKTKDSG